MPGHAWRSLSRLAEVAKSQLSRHCQVSTQKILVAAHAAGVDLYANAILRFIGRYYDGVEVYGSTFFESAEVDSWLDWGEMELANPPLQMEQALETLEKHLDQRAFVRGG
ncbi:hypothetical protein AK812_SmicGene24050 [Symbiodinium microadriaticum]|uniref:Uncharacterized protein n=1 Tax=Symbiodinium microadriaticum TaxID=2951 RepID=A0A1Q9DFQ7_SYMMI|nr:hypothetical protein AK812_SmicGene24050 [Symbiodinium microadriaticum]